MTTPAYLRDVAYSEALTQAEYRELLKGVFKGIYEGDTSREEAEEFIFPYIVKQIKPKVEEPGALYQPHGLGEPYELCNFFGEGDRVPDLFSVYFIGNLYADNIKRTGQVDMDTVFIQMGEHTEVQCANFFDYIPENMPNLKELVISGLPSTTSKRLWAFVPDRITKLRLVNMDSYCPFPVPLRATLKQGNLEQIKDLTIDDTTIAGPYSWILPDCLKNVTPNLEHLTYTYRQSRVGRVNVSSFKLFVLIFSKVLKTLTIEFKGYEIDKPFTFSMDLENNTYSLTGNRDRFNRETELKAELESMFNIKIT